jgi:hypothetical protein
MSPFLLQMVDEILFYEWDPIGVNDHLGARDEYGSYAGGICRMLHEGADEIKLANHLGFLGRVTMGLPQIDEEHNHRIVKRLRSALESLDVRDPDRKANRRRN